MCAPDTLMKRARDCVSGRPVIGMKKFTVHSYLFDIIQSVERLVYNKVAENCENHWNHNPCVGGSSPSSATK